MKMRKLFRPALAGLCAASALAALSWMAAPAVAQTATTTRFTKTVTTASVLVKGIVAGSPESVAFSGKVPVTATVVTDPDFGNPPTTVLSVDLSALSGIGRSTHASYVVGGNGIVERPLAASDTVSITFPFYASGADPSSARSGVATFALTFDLATMQMTGASGSVGGM